MIKITIRTKAVAKIFVEGGGVKARAGFQEEFGRFQTFSTEIFDRTSY